VRTPYFFLGEQNQDALYFMSRPFTLTSTVTIPVEHNNDIISVSLVQQGAVEIAYGIRLSIGGAENRPPLVPFPTSAPGRSFPNTARNALRGLYQNCFGRIFVAEQETVTLRCDFSVRGTVVASSDPALVTLKAANAARTFQIDCKFV
jgi:hypothetical protein